MRWDRRWSGVLALGLLTACGVMREPRLNAPVLLSTGRGDRATLPTPTLVPTWPPLPTPPARVDLLVGPPPPTATPAPPPPTATPAPVPRLPVAVPAAAPPGERIVAPPPSDGRAAPREARPGKRRGEARPPAGRDARPEPKHPKPDKQRGKP